MMQNSYSPIVSAVTRWFLRNWPITEGKKTIAKRFGNRSIPKHEPRVVAQMKHGFKMSLNVNNKEHAHMFLWGEHDERYETQLVKNIIKPNDVIWDIGANVGFYTMLFSKLANDGKVISFEPVSGTRSFLEQQIKINNSGNVTIKPIALGNIAGDAEIYFSESNAGEGTASLVHKNEAKRYTEKILISTIDDVLENTPEPTFLKIDVEGFQNNVFLGGQRFFTDHEPLIMAELRDSHDTMVESERIIRNYGFDIFEIKKNCVLKKCDSFTKSASRNFILCKPGSRVWARIEPLIA